MTCSRRRAAEGEGRMTRKASALARSVREGGIVDRVKGFTINYITCNNSTLRCTVAAPAFTGNCIIYD